MPTVRTGRLGCNRQNQPSDRRSLAWTSRPESTDAISSVVSCMSTDKLHERIYAPYGLVPQRLSGHNDPPSTPPSLGPTQPRCGKRD